MRYWCITGSLFASALVSKGDFPVSQKGACSKNNQTQTQFPCILERSTIGGRNACGLDKFRFQQLGGQHYLPVHAMKSAHTPATLHFLSHYSQLPNSYRRIEITLRQPHDEEIRIISSFASYKKIASHQHHQQQRHQQQQQQAAQQAAQGAEQRLPTDSNAAMMLVRNKSKYFHIYVYAFLHIYETIVVTKKKSNQNETRKW